MPRAGMRLSLGARSLPGMSGLPGEAWRGLVGRAVRRSVARGSAARAAAVPSVHVARYQPATTTARWELGGCVLCRSVVGVYVVVLSVGVRGGYSTRCLSKKGKM